MCLTSDELQFPPSTELASIPRVASSGFCVSDAVWSLKLVLNDNFTHCFCFKEVMNNYEDSKFHIPLKYNSIHSASQRTPQITVMSHFLYFHRASDNVTTSSHTLFTLFHVAQSHTAKKHFTKQWKCESRHDRQNNSNYNEQLSDKM